ncbi:Acyl-CoA N-acyltransferases (Nat) [Glarea lozoyensis ATCC 20868]|uniref:Acyl-CoA N-acyltransferases (Nat) n=1 Tax=Glarea lozoyensis (strain ATCC 20868 / MF5171) TaxID=1116229 RepID=S3DF94_GLAL2|nr:Acyl-CoA N-acyltransferases (Nat) [Glarea lozoyensis ATCC 20868]EPE35769.1 Acyl-CoA N-acyltransferases (Nat) [Glarea lozoyensis ATCC 20868]
MSTPPPIIRHAYLSDVPTILKFIHDLAAFEKEPASTVEATEKSLADTIAFDVEPGSEEGNRSGATEQKTENNTSTENTTAISPTRPARCLILLAPSSSSQSPSSLIPVGIALYFYNYSTWRAKPGIYLEDLYVSPDHRGKGYGTALLRTLAKEVVDMGGGRLDWSVLRWNEKAIRVYEGVGAGKMDEWVGMRVEGEGLVKLAGL